jgi:transcriptional regulator with PAS, ATPase and Fis domain
VQALKPGLQAKLLSVLQEKVIRRVGGRENIGVDVRVIGASNQDNRVLA